MRPQAATRHRACDSNRNESVRPVAAATPVNWAHLIASSRQFRRSRPFVLAVHRAVLRRAGPARWKLSRTCLPPIGPASAGCQNLSIGGRILSSAGVFPHREAFLMEKRPGHYLGTEIGESWWRRYRADGFFARGNGELWLDESGLWFSRYLTQRSPSHPLQDHLTRQDRHITRRKMDTGTPDRQGLVGSRRPAAVLGVRSLDGRRRHASVR